MALRCLLDGTPLRSEPSELAVSTNEQIRGDDDPWLEWVREQLAEDPGPGGRTTPSVAPANHPIHAP